MKMDESISISQQLIDKVSAIIKPCYLSGAQLLLQNNLKLDSIVIKLENNPWRNDIIKGNSIFARVKANGDTPYLNFKNRFKHLLDGFGIIQLTAPEAETKYDWMRIDLQSFMQILNDPSDDFIHAINEIFTGCVAFPAFGCCSKHEECEKQGKCLHTDQLYATACQWQKHLKRTGKFE